MEIIPRIKYSFSQNQKSIIQTRQQAMDLEKTTVHMMKREEADAVPMRMRWGHTEIIIRMQSIQSTMGIFGGGSVRRAIIVIMRPKWTIMAGSISVVVMSTIGMSVCGPLCI